MTKREYENVIRAMLAASNLMPYWKDNYYENFCGQSIANFLNGIVEVFGVPGDWYMFGHNNLQELFGSGPEDTLEWFMEHKALVENGDKS